MYTIKKNTFILTKDEMIKFRQIMFQASTDKRTTSEIRDFAWKMHHEAYDIFNEGIEITFNKKIKDDEA